MLPRFTPGFKRFAIRLVAFLSAFLLLSVFLGPMIVSTQLLSGMYFYVYGGLGYLVLFSAIAFLILSRHKLKDINYSYNGSVIFGVLSLLLAIAFRLIGGYVGTHFSAFAGSEIVLLLMHALFLSIFIFLALAIFGFRFFFRFYRDFRKELLICLCMAFVFYLAMFYIWSMWTYLSVAVTRLVYWMARLTFETTISPPYDLCVQGFCASILQPCSGVYSIFLFSCLFVLLLVVDWNALNKKKAVIVFPLAIVGVFFVNVLRIYTLFLIGAFVSPSFAIGGFHSYAGMVFFIAYFVLFMYFAYGWLKR